MKYRVSDYLNHVRGFADKGLTLGQIQLIRTWLTSKGFENQLHMERVDGKNLVYIRVLLSQPVDFEAAWLFTLRSQRPTRAKLADLFLERMQVA